MANRNRVGASRRARRSWTSLCVATGLLWVGGGSVPAEGADDAPRPNILFAIADDWSFGHAGAYGCQWVRTPGFDRVAREGVLFRRAYTPNAKCAPSRACLLTGRNSWQLKDACNHVCYFPPEFKTYAEALAEYGYAVGFTGKGWGPGVANDAAGKRRQLLGRAFNQRTTDPPAEAMSRNDYAENFTDFLASVPEGSPWCFWYGTTEPHRGYQYGVGLSQGGKRLTDIDRVPAFFPDNETIRTDLLDYSFEVEYFDQHLVRILAQLEQSDQLQNTLVIVTSDHGMPFPRCKGQAYDYSNHVPLAVMWPERILQPGRVEEHYVSFVDLAPTLLHAAGVSWEESGMQPLAGHAWTDVFKNKTNAARRNSVLIGKERHDIGRPHDWGYPIRGILRDDLLLIRNYEPTRWPAGNPETGYLNCDGGPTKTYILDHRTDAALGRFWDLCFGRRPTVELYNLKDDADCVRNLAGDSSYAAVREQLEASMIEQLTAQSDPRMLGEGDYFDQIPFANSQTRHFYERYMGGEKLRAGWVNPTDFETEPLD